MPLHIPPPQPGTIKILEQPQGDGTSQWQLETNISDKLLVFQVLMILAQNMALEQMKKDKPLIEKPTLVLH